MTSSSSLGFEGLLLACKPAANRDKSPGAFPNQIPHEEILRFCREGTEVRMVFIRGTAAAPVTVVDPLKASAPQLPMEINPVSYRAQECILNLARCIRQSDWS